MPSPRPEDILVISNPRVVFSVITSMRNSQSLDPVIWAWASYLKRCVV